MGLRRFKIMMRCDLMTSSYILLGICYYFKGTFIEKWEVDKWRALVNAIDIK